MSDMREIIRRVHTTVDKLSEIADRYDRDVLVEGLTKQLHKDLSAIMRLSEEKSRDEHPMEERVRRLGYSAQQHREKIDALVSSHVELSHKVESLSQTLQDVFNKWCKSAT